MGLQCQSEESGCVVNLEPKLTSETIDVNSDPYTYSSHVGSSALHASCTGLPLQLNDGSLPTNASSSIWNAKNGWMSKMTPK